MKKKMFYLSALLLGMLITVNSSANPVFNITDYGAAGDSATLNTKSIQEAIDEASESGGGTVVVPNGTFLTGTIYLKNDVTLHINKGASLLGSPKLKHYPVNPFKSYDSYTERYSKRALIWAEGKENIAVTGMGTINGNGDAPGFHKDSLITTEYDKKPLGLRFISCNDILVRDVHLRNAGVWMQHYLNCENLTISNVKVFNHGNFTNDGLNIDGCRKVRVSNCFINSHDDAVALKSTGPAPCEDVTITNCVLNSHCHGFKMGTESTGGFKRINISNCVVRASNVQHPKMPDIDRMQVITAIALEIVDGGTMEDIQVNNITAEHVFSPIFIKLGNRARKYKEGIEKPEPGTLKDVTISNLTATNAGPFSSSITGFPGHYVKNVSLSNIRISHYGGGKKDEIMEEVPENEKDYPEMKMFGNDWHGPRLPSYGLFIRHVKNITMNNVQITLQNPDAREPIILEDVHGLQADKISQKILPK